MVEEDKSGFHLYSIGVVSEDMDEDSHIIEAFPVEQQSHIDGDIAYNKKSNILSKDIHNKANNVVLNRKSTVEAIWLPSEDSNRVTAPTIRKGEQVKIYRYGNTNTFYWTTLFNEFDLRRNEKVKKYYSNTSVPKEDLNDNNTYWEEVDTINKHWKLHTSDNDGELCTWDISLDTKEGILETIDGRGNFIKHSAKDDTLTTSFKKEINVLAPTINMKADTMNIIAGTLNEDVGTKNTKATNYNAAINKMGIKGSNLTHNDKNIGSTHTHPESIGSRTGDPS